MSTSIVLLSLVLSFSTATANPLWGVWSDLEGDGVMWTFREDGSFKRAVPIAEDEAAGLFAEMFGELLDILSLDVENLVELGVVIPTIKFVTVEGKYTTENDSLVAYGASFLLEIEERGRPQVDFGELMAEVAGQLLERLDGEMTDLEQIHALTVVAESGPLLTEFVIVAMQKDGPLIASSFSVQENRLRLDDNEYARMMFMRLDGTAAGAEPTSWGQLKNRFDSY